LSADTVLVTGRIVDADTGELIPARLYITSSNGEAYFANSPDMEGTYVVYNVSRGPDSVEQHVTLSPHGFSSALPPGDYTLVAERGKEYLPFQTTIKVGDEPLEVELPLERWINMADRGWYSGDTHVHRTLRELPNVMLAEDLNVALPLSYWVREAYVPPLKADDTVDVIPSELIAVDETHVIWPMNTEYEIFTVNGVSHTLGAVFVLNHQSPLRPPAPPVGPIAQAARDEGALLDLDKHSWNWSMMLLPAMNVDLFELSNNHIWRTEFAFTQWTTDVQPADWDIETSPLGWTEWGWTDFGFKTYYALLNCGFKMRPTGGTASGVHPVPLGFGRIYVPIEGEFTYDKWMEQLDAGTGFVTTGPMLFARVNAQPGGSTIVSDDGSEEITVTVSAESARALDRIEVIINGDIAATLDVTNTPREDGGFLNEAEVTLTIDETSWVAVRCFEEAGDGRYRFAHTGPTYIEIEGRPQRARLREVNYFVQRMETEIARNRGILSDAEVAEYESALQFYESLRETARD
jgi:hypothetical protein